MLTYIKILIGTREIRGMNLDKIVKEKQMYDDIEYHNKYIGVFQTAIDYVKHQDVLMYGGLAVNEYMPMKYKIYDANVLPDVDVFCMDPERLAKNVVEYLKNKGYNQATSYARALHTGTYAVYSSGHKVLDISLISPEDMRSLKRGGSKGMLGIPCVSPLFLRLTFHVLLATSSVERWAKMHERMLSFYKVFPPENAKLGDITMKLPTDKAVINDSIHYYLEKRSEADDTVLIGTPIVNLMIEKDIDEFKNLPFSIALVQDNCKTYAETMVTALADTVPGLRISEVHPNNELIFLPEHVIVSQGSKTVAIIFQADLKCFNYIKYKGVCVGTIHTVLMLYLAMTLSSESCFVKMKPTIKVIADALTDMLLHSKSRSKVMKPLSLSCMGVKTGIATLRRQRFAKS